MTQPTPNPGSTPPAARGSSSGRTDGGLSGGPEPMLDDQPTVISTRGSSGPEAPLSGRLSPAEIGNQLVGQQLGQFLLETFVGGGGMGAVFRALDTTLNREVAVKVLSRGHAADEETLRRFQNEAQSAARLNHENIARVYYVGEDRGVHYIVFEYVDGINIRDLVARDGPLPLSDALSYTLQVAEALAHISQRDVIHRDIKPSNVLVTPEGKAKLVDMGLARLHQVDQVGNDLTASGVTLGTFDYISPEQARDPRSADVRSDIYSLGCSLYYMLTGHPPFPDGTLLQKLLQHQEAAPPDPRLLRGELPHDLIELVVRMLAKNPEERFQTAGELIAAILLLCDQLGIPATSANAIWAPRQPAIASWWRENMSWIAPLAALGVIVLALNRYWSAVETPAAGPPAIASSVKPEKTVDAGSGTDSRSTGAQQRTDVESTGVNAPPTRTPGSHNADTPGTGAARIGSDVPRAPSGVADLLAHGGITFDQFAGEVYAAARSFAELAPLGSAGAERPNSSPAARGSRSGSKSPARPDDVDSLLIVSESDEGPRSYTTLEAACSAAKSGDAVELRYSGRRVERPISLANVRLTIRAGKGFRPVVAFEPNEADPVKYPRAMISLTGGQLSLVDVHLELVVPRDIPADGWTLFETRRAELVRLERSSLTVRNASFGQASLQPGVAFFSLRAPPGAESMMIMPLAGQAPEGEPQAVAIELQDCVARGEAALLKLVDLESARLVWDNGLLLTSERLIASAGAPASPRQVAHVQADLRHVTAVMRSGMCGLLGSAELPYLPTVEINCTDSILLVGGGAPLVEQRAPERPESLRTRLHWNANRAFYEGIDVFWRVSTAGESSSAVNWTFTDWYAFWGQSHETQPKRDVVAWKNLPGPLTPLHSQSPSDYQLAAGSRNPARSGASDGSDAGSRLDRLPPLLAPGEADEALSDEPAHPGGS